MFFNLLLLFIIFFVLGFEWDYTDAIANYPHCNFDMSSALSYHASHSDGSSSSIPRIVSITGSMVSDHPLAGVSERFYKDYLHIIHKLHDSTLQNFLLQPNSFVEERIKKVRKELKSKRSKHFESIIGIQIRTGYADNKSVELRPSNANFLAIGDENLFLNKFKELFQTRFQSNPDKIRVFLMTDSPHIEDYIKTSIEKQFKGVRVITVSEGSIAHSGPQSTISKDNFHRLLTEWFIFKQMVDLNIITAWSLFGSSAVEGKDENNIFRIDASNCGEKGAKPCQMQ
jgi:hypothetical protein